MDKLLHKKLKKTEKKLKDIENLLNGVSVCDNSLPCVTMIKRILREEDILTGKPIHNDYSLS